MSLQIGGVIFKRKQYEAISNQFSTDKKIMRNLIRCSHWNIQHNEYKSDKWNILFSIMIESIVEKIDLKLTYFQPILKNICHIKFPNLMELNLQVNNIESIEPLVSLNAPILEKLILSNNRIVSLRPLSKINCKYIQTFAIDGNQIIDFYPMTLANFPKRVDKLILQNWDQRKLQVEHIAFMLKMTPRQIKNICTFAEISGYIVERENRIKHERTLSMLEDKYKKIIVK